VVPAGLIQELNCIVVVSPIEFENEIL